MPASRSTLILRLATRSDEDAIWEMLLTMTIAVDVVILGAYACFAS